MKLPIFKIFEYTFIFVPCDAGFWLGFYLYFIFNFFPEKAVFFKVLFYFII